MRSVPKSACFIHVQVKSIDPSEAPRQKLPKQISKRSIGPGKLPC